MKKYVKTSTNRTRNTRKAWKKISEAEDSPNWIAPIKNLSKLRSFRRLFLTNRAPIRTCLTKL